jgi:hypothetical protein
MEENVCPRESLKHIIRETGGKCVSKRELETHYKRKWRRMCVQEKA